MSLPTVTQTWTYSFNNRLTYVAQTSIQINGAVMFSLVGVGGFLPSTMGWTVKGSCDGTTGAMDGVNRITAATKWATRFSGAAGAQSWIVLTDGAGVDHCFSYNSSADDINRYATSTGGVYLVAGTANQQPTATDEMFDAASGTWTNATLSADRVWHFWGSSDKKIWRMAICRSGALISYIKGEKFTSALVAPATFTLATGGGTVGLLKSYYNTYNFTTALWTAYTAVTNADLCRVHAAGIDINCKAGLGGETLGGASSGVATSAEKPALQGGQGENMFPAQVGGTLASADGKLGTVIDHWYVITNSGGTPTLMDTFGNLQFVALGSGIILPLDGVSVPVSS